MCSTLLFVALCLVKKSSVYIIYVAGSDFSNACGSGGGAGGFMQPQGHLQVLSNMLDCGSTPQAAIDHPRFCITALPNDARGHGPHSVEISHVDFEAGPGREEMAEELRKMGHDITVVSGWGREVFGRGQIIWRDPKSGVLWGGSEGRADGCAMGW